MLCCRKAMGVQDSQLGNTLTKCLHSCQQANNLSLHFSGVLHKSIERDSTVVHFVRSPADMVLSGYLYHYTCAEKDWTNVTMLSNKLLSLNRNRFGSYGSERNRVGALLNVSWGSTTTYCQALQRADVWSGLLAEAYRSLVASDGIAAMLKAHQHLTGRTTGRLLNVCMSDYYRPRTARANATWAALSQFLGLQGPEVAELGSARHQSRHGRARTQQGAAAAWSAAELSCLARRALAHVATWRFRKGLVDSKLLLRIARSSDGITEGWPCASQETDTTCQLPHVTAARGAT